MSWTGITDFMDDSEQGPGQAGICERCYEVWDGIIRFREATEGNRLRGVGAREGRREGMGTGRLQG
jgi:hypothetical protein